MTAYTRRCVFILGAGAHLFYEIGGDVVGYGTYDKAADVENQDCKLALSQSKASLDFCFIMPTPPRQYIRPNRSRLA